jgi:acyl-CoA oxidase
MRYTSFWFFREKVTNGSIKCKKLEGHITKLCLLYGLVHLKKDTSACYESGYFAGKPFTSFINEAIKQLLKDIRPYAISLVEGYGVDDEVLCSAIGNSYGDIYETHLRWAKDSKLNHTKLGDAIPDGYMENVHPLKGKL